MYNLAVMSLEAVMKYLQVEICQFITSLDPERSSNGLTWSSLTR